MRPLRVVILTSNTAGNAARIAEYLIGRLTQGQIVGAIVDRGTSHDRRRQLRRLQAWRHHGGLTYAAWRLWLEVGGRIRKSPREHYPRTLYQIGTAAGFPVVDVPNVNSRLTLETLRTLDCQLGVSIGNRIIEREIFSAPEFGMLNLHHGRMPDYRGGPPAFWEIYNGETEMGVSVHQIDDALDHGPVVARGSVPIDATVDPRTLMARAYGIDADLVLQAIESVARGEPPLGVEDGSGGAVRTLPSRKEIRALSARLGRRVRHDDFRRAPLPVSR